MSEEPYEGRNEVCLSLSYPGLQKIERLYDSIMATEIKSRIRCYAPGL